MKNKIKTSSKLNILPFILILLSTTIFAKVKHAHDYDVCVYGGTSSGVIAAYSAKMMGKSVILIEPGQQLGGMSAGGLGYTDIGNKYVVTGLALDFYRRIGEHYGKLEQWVFEPKVAEMIFDNYIKNSNLELWKGMQLKGVSKNKNQISEIIVENSDHPGLFSWKRVKAKVFIDCSHEGDLMAQAKVSYTIGREANSVYNETFNGVQMLDRHQFPDGIDPYVIPGDSSSGFLWGISPTKVAENGTSDKKIQAYNFRVALTNVKENRIDITKPDNYDPKKYELLIRFKEKNPWTQLRNIFIWGKMPNGKTDLNNLGPFSLDMIGYNWDYPEASYAERKKIFKAHEDYTKGLFYFIATDDRIPEFIRNEMKEWGYPKDEYLHNNHWTTQLYIRESRRMIGDLVMTQQHCQGKEIVSDAIGMAAYTMDSHNCDRHVVNGMVKNEGNVEEGGFPPYPISYRSITPKKNEVSNLLVPFCMSASHIAYGSIRMEPVFMVLGQSAGIAAILAIDNNKNVVQDVDVSKIQTILKNNPRLDKSLSDIVIDNTDASNVEISGNWKVEEGKFYGRNALVADNIDKRIKTVKFIPVIKNTGNYDVYIYYPKIENLASTVSVTIFSEGGLTEKIIKSNEVLIQGQTSGVWHPLGTYNFSQEKNGYVQLSNKTADGLVVADAVLLVPKRD